MEVVMFTRMLSIGAMMFFAGCTVEVRKMETEIGFGFRTEIYAHISPDLRTTDATIEGVAVIDVNCKSEADKIGILVGDELYAINGNALPGRSAGQFIELLNVDKAVFTFRRRSKDGPVAIEVELRKGVVSLDDSCGRPKPAGS